MINDFSTIICTDLVTLAHLAKEPDRWEDEEECLKIKVAALRIFSVLGMTLASIWLLKVVASVITYPIRIAAKLAVPVIMLVVLRDVFVMCQNATEHQLVKDNQEGLCGLFGALRTFKKEDADKFTQDTLLQHMWMWIYHDSMNH